MNKDYDRRFTHRTLIMGILNCTPDSFSDGGMFFEHDKAVSHARQMIDDGADIIDIGGESTRPGFTPVDDEEEIRRVIPVFEALRGEDVILSADTTKPVVARAAAEAGCSIINDISGDLKSSGLADVAAEYGTHLVVMFNCRNNGACTGDIYGRIKKELTANIDHAISRGVSEDRIIIDPGIGFGTTRQQDLEITKELHRITGGRYPVLYAASRKRIVAELTGCGDDAAARDSASDALALFAALQGASVIRSHRIKELKAGLAVFDRICEDE